MKKSFFLNFLGIMTLFVQMFKVFYGFGSLTQGWFFAIIWVVLYVIIFPKDVLQIRLIPFFFFYIVAVVHHIMGSTCQRFNTISDMAYLFSYYLYPFLYFYFLANHTGIRSKKYAAALLSIIILFYAIRTVWVTGGDTYFIRRISDDMDHINFYRLLGLADYSLTHAIVFMAPVFVYLLKSSEHVMGKLIGLVLLCTSFILIYFGGATTPMLLFFFSLVLSFIVSSKRNNKDNLIVLTLSLLFVVPIVNKTMLLSLLSFIAFSLPFGSPFSRKVIDFENSLIHESAEGDVGTRLSLYADSWDTFFSHPLFGTLNGDLIGGHAYFADLLAALGIFGAGFLFYYLYSVFKYTYSVIPLKSKPYYLLGMLLFVILGFVKNLSGNDFFIIPFIYLPLMCMVSNNTKKSALL